MNELGNVPDGTPTDAVNERMELTRHRHSLLVAWAWWFASTFALAIGWVSSTRSGLIAASAVLLLGSGVAFIRMGGRRVTASGVYFLSIGILIAAPVLYVALLRPQDPVPGLFEFTCAVSFATALTYSLRVRKRSADPGDESTEPADVPPHSSRWLARFGVACLLLAIGLSFGAREALSSAAHALASIGFVSLAANAALIFRGTVTRRFVAATAVALFAFLVFVTTFFSGFGRLILVGLVFAAWLVLATLDPQRWHKPVMLAVLVPALVAGGIIGITRSGGDASQISVQQILGEERGLGSWTGPPLTAADLIARDASGVGTPFPRLYGLTYIEAVLIPVPRAVWPDKPVGFGTRLTQVLLPAYLPYGHSMAATSFGESYANFGWLGFVALGTIMAPALGALDRWQLRIARSDLEPDGIVRLLMFVIVAAGIPDFIWGGLASTTARAGIRAIVLLGVLAVVSRSRSATLPKSQALATEESM